MFKNQFLLFLYINIIVMNNYINNVYQDFKKFDTLLAFSVSLLLFYFFTFDIQKALLFSLLFFFIFLIILNLKY